MRMYRSLAEVKIIPRCVKKKQLKPQTQHRNYFLLLIFIDYSSDWFACLALFVAVEELGVEKN